MVASPTLLGKPRLIDKPPFRIQLDRSQLDQALTRRGIDKAANYAQWEPGSYYDKETDRSWMGWYAPIFDANGKPITHNGKPLKTWKNGDKSSESIIGKDRWLNYDKARPKPLLLPKFPHSIINEVLRANGALFGCEGKPDCLTLWSALCHTTILNAIGFMGGYWIPDDLADQFRSWGVTKFVYYCHFDAVNSVGQRLTDLLHNTGIELVLIPLPTKEEKKIDLNDLWVQAGFNTALFWSWIADLKPIVLSVSTPKPIVKPASNRPTVTTENERRRRAYCDQALDREVDKVIRAGTGQGNNQLYKSACNVGELIGTGYLDRSCAEFALMQAAFGRGKSEQESSRTIQSGINRGIKKPRDLSCCDENENPVLMNDRAASKVIDFPTKAEPSPIDATTGEIYEPEPLVWTVDGNLTKGALKLIDCAFKHPTSRAIMTVIATHYGDHLTAIEIAEKANLTPKQVRDAILRNETLSRLLSHYAGKGAFLTPCIPTIEGDSGEESRNAPNPMAGANARKFTAIPFPAAVDVITLAKIEPEILNRCGNRTMIPAYVMTLGETDLNSAIVTSAQVNAELPDDPMADQFRSQVELRRAGFLDMTPLPPVDAEFKAHPIAGVIAAEFKERGVHRFRLTEQAAKYGVKPRTLRREIKRAGLELTDQTHSEKLTDPTPIPVGTFVKGKGFIDAYEIVDNDQVVKNAQKAVKALEYGLAVNVVYRHSGKLCKPDDHAEKLAQEQSERDRRAAAIALTKDHKPAAVKPAQTVTDDIIPLWPLPDDKGFIETMAYVSAYPKAMAILTHLTADSVVTVCRPGKRDNDDRLAWVNETIAAAAAIEFPQTRLDANQICETKNEAAICDSEKSIEVATSNPMAIASNLTHYDPAAAAAAIQASVIPAPGTKLVEKTIIGLDGKPVKVMVRDCNGLPYARPNEPTKGHETGLFSLGVSNASR